MNVQLEKRMQHVAELVRGLNAVSPLQVLARGYSITYDAEGNVVRQGKQVQVGDEIFSTLDDGQISSSVTKIKEQN